MKRQEILSILITFVMGVACGAYLYVSGFSQIFDLDEVPEAEELSEFVIVGEAYGGCRSNCPTFRVLTDGSYRYLFTPGVGQSQVVREGRLPFGLQRELRAALSAPRLAKQAVLTSPATCSSYSDGIDVQYNITLDGNVYQLNSCGTAVNVSEPPWSALAKIWNYFETEV